MDWEKVKELFYEAIDRPSVLEDAEPELRAEVESLLSAHSQVPEEPEYEGPGTEIGPYKLLQKIGEGGFGTVYMAEQVAPLRRRVALKIIKLGMDTAQVVARFEAERQALALMDHPNIARVLDGGVTETGRPYFVMELVRGIRITDYCDQGQLDTRERLELFRGVCRAVQHAHVKGIIHRDLKPSNVLVTLHDGQPVPKVIDFGIAKATNRHLTERTLFTEFRQMIGTPEYMAPEQAGLSGLDVDSRADVYSLGVLLYELLTGTKPFLLKTLLRHGYEEVLRTIREVDPPKPSTRISALGAEAEPIARRHDTTPTLLTRAVRGDLDWIAMKALDKDRARRYQTADAFSADVERFLRHEPVGATPPSTPYRLRKYLRRHRVGATIGTALVAVLVTSGALAYAGMHAVTRETAGEERAASDARERARDARRAEAAEAAARARSEAGAAEAERETSRADAVVGFLDQVLTSADPHDVKGRNYSVHYLLDDIGRELDEDLESEPEVEATVRTMIGAAYRNLGLYDEAARHLRRGLEIRRRSDRDGARYADSLHEWSELLRHRGDHEQAEEHGRRALEIRTRVLGDDHVDACLSLRQLARVLSSKGDLEAAESLLRRCLALHSRERRETRRYYNTLGALGGVLAQRREYGEAEPMLLEGYEGIHALGSAAAEERAALRRLVQLYEAWGKPAEAEVWRSQQ